jgi:uncharacterized heparinase superfamily protein
MSLATCWRTVRFLQMKQIYYQIRRRVLPPRLLKTPPLLPESETRRIQLIPGVLRPQKYWGQGRFVFLNSTLDFGDKIDWQASDRPRLWQYNLHYFDYLTQREMDYDTGLALVKAWIENHLPQPGSVGWEAYPLSLRIINWIKFFSRWGNTPDQIKQSLLLQVINLERQLEYHLGGNHLWANGKALWFAGLFLQKPQVAIWGKKIIFEEIGLQFLPDGGHFELSPLYHSIITEDLLDLINLSKSVNEVLDDRESAILNTTASRALGWLGEVIDGQGKFPLLNDAAYGVAATYGELVEYGNRLGVAPVSPGFSELALGRWSGRDISGYRVFTNGPFRLIWDTAPLGPEHLLGHAHCDMLSLLLDYEGQNILTDTGVSQYEEGAQRQYERGVSAHNTVTLDGWEQAEIWKSFRVGRRGYPIGFRQEGETLRCCHTGFEIWQPGLQHERMLSFQDNGFEVTDYLRGPGRHRYQSFFHFAPGVQIEEVNKNDYLINNKLLFRIWGTETQLRTSGYSPEFGRKIIRPCLILQGEFGREHSLGLKCLASR